MKETGKSIQRRLHDSRFATRYFVGTGIDIGSGDDALSLYGELFPSITGLRPWDLPDGDAQTLNGVTDEQFDFVHSSHCLEHLSSPMQAMANWFRVLKPGGHLVILVPDEDLYEMGHFPSKLNSDHKWTFALYKTKSWSPKSINVTELVTTLGAQAQVLKLELLDAGYRYRLASIDQTMTPIGECAIEIVIRKRLPSELAAGGRLPSLSHMSIEEYYALTGIRVKNA
jgi:SAM-dependent methyltransferase